MMYWLQDLRDSIEYRLEVMGERFLDGCDRLRKPILFFMLVCAVMTVKEGRKGIGNIRVSLMSGLRGGSFGVGNGGVSSMYSAYSSYGAGAGVNKAQSTAALCDQHGSRVRPLRSGVLWDYGGVSTF